MPFPPSWPTYIPKDKLAAWFEAYVESLELNYWTGTEFESGVYDEAQARWSVVLRRTDGTRRQMHPRHVVMATGVSGIPSLPDIPTLRNFGGTVLHSSQYADGEAWKGKTALVVGTGNSGHDIAQDLHCERRQGHPRSTQLRPWSSMSSRARSCPTRSTAKDRPSRTATSSPRRCRWRSRGRATSA